MNRICEYCGGAIFPSNMVVGYAGPLCSCKWTKPLLNEPLQLDKDAEITQLRQRIAELELENALYAADEKHCWNHIPELKNTDAQYELHEAVGVLAERIKELEAQGEQVGYFVESISAGDQINQVEQVSPQYKDDKDVFPLYRSAPRIPDGWHEVLRNELKRGELMSNSKKFEFMKESGLDSLDDVHDWMLKARNDFVTMAEAMLAEVLNTFRYCKKHLLFSFLRHASDMVCAPANSRTVYSLCRFLQHFLPLLGIVGGEGWKVVVLHVVETSYSSIKRCSPRCIIHIGISRCCSHFEYG